VAARVARIGIASGGTYTFCFRSPEHFVEFFARWCGPTARAFAALDEPGRAALADDIVALVRSYDRHGEDGSVAIPSEYLETVATRAA
jgi:hypothetical protein